MKKLSIKLGFLFFLVMFGLMSFMFFYLHKGLVQSTVDEQLNSLQARGNSHREALKKQFDKELIDHVVLMESEAITDVVITDSNGKILGSSSASIFIHDLLQKTAGPIPYEGKIIEGDWKKEKVIATISPVQNNGQTMGYVYMFQDTQSIHELIERLNDHFIFAGTVSVILTLIIIFFLSRGIANPLIKMKEATFEISRGNFSVSLPKMSDDELGDLAKSIETLAVDLNHLTKERNEFLSSISHELRTPLTFIKGYADILNKRELSKEEREKYLSIIVQETNRLSNLIKDLFELAKIDQNTFAIQKEPIDLKHYFSQIHQKFSPAFQEKRIHFFINCDPGLYLHADPARLDQIIYNLLDNAIKYSDKGAKVQLEAWEEKGNVHISIQDNGKGIPEEDLPHIFKRFYRVDKSRTRSLGGTGLGLAIVKELVQAHHGKLEVQSKLGHGTRFDLIFPGGKRG